MISEWNQFTGRFTGHPVLCRNHPDTSHALGGFAPAAGASPVCDNDVLPVLHLSPSHCAPSPCGGLTAQEGGIVLHRSGLYSWICSGATP